MILMIVIINVAFFKVLMDCLHFLLLILSEFKHLLYIYYITSIPPKVIRKPFVFSWFLGKWKIIPKPSTWKYWKAPSLKVLKFYPICVKATSARNWLFAKVVRFELCDQNVSFLKCNFWCLWKYSVILKVDFFHIF